ncbi:MAG: CrcB family protein [Chthoniobacteraceae bacterium]
MTTYLWIALGSALGGILRFWLSERTGRWFESLLGAPQTFAFLGTVFVNVTGSFFIGFLAGLGPLPFTRQLFMIGVLGGYTTFSSFSLQTLELAHEGRWLHAGGNVALSVALALVAVWLGHWCGAAWRK